jgi:hypothetical protein
VLGSVVALFIAFVVIQFQYFFGGQANINIEGYTFSEYARKGFGELVAVAFFSLLMLLSLGAITRRETDTQRKSFSILGVTLVGLVIVMLFSAFQRLGLYEFAYGFSRLRTYTHVFMIWLGLLLTAVAILEVLRRERSIGLVMVIAAIGFVVSLSVMNVDGFIVKHNIQREIDGLVDGDLTQGRASLDNQYFLDLSDDAVPALVNGFTNDALPKDTREKIGAALVCKRYDRQSDVYPWQSFQLSRVFADAAFADVNVSLNTYKLTDEEWSAQVETPGGEIFSCYPYYD